MSPGRPDELADLAARVADVRRADFDPRESLAPAFAGGERLLLISTDVVGERVAGHQAAIDAAAAAVLSGGDEHSGKAYDITGPELIGAADLARLYAQAGGMPVEAVNVSDAEFIEGLVAAGLPPGVGELLASFGAAIRNGQLDELSSDVQDLTRRAPAPLSSVLASVFAGAG